MRATDADRARAAAARPLEGRWVTAYDRHPETGLLRVYQGRLGHVHDQDMHLLLGEVAGMYPTRVHRIMAHCLLAIHAAPEAGQGTAMADLETGDVLAEGPYAGATVIYADPVGALEIQTSDGKKREIHIPPTVQLLRADDVPTP